MKVSHDVVGHPLHPTFALALAPKIPFSEVNVLRHIHGKHDDTTDEECSESDASDEY